MRFLDLSGYSFTGKSAYNHLIAEFGGFHVHPFDMEFDLLRTKGGILDLAEALIGNWSPVRSSEAVREFKVVAHAYRGSGGLLDRLTTIGRQYDARFPGFTALSRKYIEELIQARWLGAWPYPGERLSKSQVIARKLLSVCGMKNVFEQEVYLSAPSPECFVARTRQYLSDVLSSGVPAGTKTIVMNNVFEPFNPSASMRFFDTVKAIVVDRDPRDIYLAAWDYTNRDGSKGWQATLGGSVEDFVERYLSYRKHVSKEQDANVLRVSFEDLVLEYPQMLTRVYDFLEIDASLHVDKGKYFKPEISRAGVDMWRDGRRADDVAYIHDKLAAYCRDGA